MLDGWERRCAARPDPMRDGNGMGTAVCRKEGRERRNIKFVKRINEHAPLAPERTSKVDTRQRKEADLRSAHLPMPYLSDLST